MVSTREVGVADGRILRVHDSGEPAALTLVWHTGSPQTGALLAPVLAAAQERDVRLVSYGRPGYGGSSASVGRDVASAAADVAAVLDALGVDRFAAMGASGGGPHALACAALLADRCVAAVTLAGIAPFTGRPEWFDGMKAPGGLQAALDGVESRERFAEHDDFDPAQFIDADYAALEGAWASLGADAGAAGREGPRGLVDDDVAFVSEWGFDPASIAVPVLVVQGGLDRVVPPAHGEQLAATIPGATLWREPLDGHVSVLRALPAALDWVLAR